MGLFNWRRRRQGKTVKVLHKTPWRSLHSVSAPRFKGQEFVYLHETYCDGQVVAVLPYRRSAHGYEFLIRYEIVPCWDIDMPTLCTITGATDKNSSRAGDAARELAEETGYQVDRRALYYLGESRGTKAADTVYTLFGVNLGGMTSGALAQEEGIESEGRAVWVTVNELATVTDPLVHVMYVRLLPRLLAGKVDIR